MILLKYKFLSNLSKYINNNDTIKIYFHQFFQNILIIMILLKNLFSSNLSKYFAIMIILLKFFHQIFQNILKIMILILFPSGLSKYISSNDIINKSFLSNMISSNKIIYNINLH